MRALAALLLAVFCAASALPASAQDRTSAYVVAGVRADATAANSSDARNQAFSQAQQAAFERVVRRVTLSDDLTRLGAPAVTPSQLDALVSSVEVEEERLSGTRYFGRLTVRFAPAGVRTLLRNAGFTVVDTRTSPMVVIPQASGGPNDTAQAWGETWAQGGFQQELVPLVATTTPVEGAPSWDTAQGAARSASAASAIYAVLRVSGRTGTVSLTEVGPNGLSRDRGSVQGQVQNGDGLRSSLMTLAQASSDRIQNDWRARSSTSTGGRSRISASALYANQGEWERIKDGLERAAASTISEIRIEAVGREGALVSFAYTGDQNTLVADLRRQGVSLENAAGGVVLRAARR